MADLILTDSQQVPTKANHLINSFFKEMDYDQLQEVVLNWFCASMSHEETADEKPEDRAVQCAFYKDLFIFLRDIRKEAAIE